MYLTLYIICIIICSEDLPVNNSGPEKSPNQYSPCLIQNMVKIRKLHYRF